ncbi:Uncharacterised protein [Bordetella pertussis]|nr:Uncharacterised protein [Bordetella pertussis]CFW35214.1 Uncharacterised protein [Bordetella pertussis]
MLVATKRAPMVPAAPGFCSTTMGWPRMAATSSMISRAKVSVVPPAW